MKYILSVLIILSITSKSFPQPWSLEFSGSYGKTLSDDLPETNNKTSFGVQYLLHSFISLGIKLDNEFFYGHGSSAVPLSYLQVFTIPVGIYVQLNTKFRPYIGALLGPSFPNRYLVGYKIFLTAAINGGFSYNIKQFSPFVQFEYAHDLTGFCKVYHTTPAPPNEKVYNLNRYYVTAGVLYRIL